jgi:membrane peptidoglycan carboxypeptidase
VAAAEGSFEAVRSGRFTGNRYESGHGRLLGASTISMQTAKNVFLMAWPRLAAESVRSLVHAAD